MLTAEARAREAWGAAMDSAKASSEDASDSSSGDGEALTRTTSVGSGSEKKRLGESDEAEDWEAREKRRRKGKHGSIGSRATERSGRRTRRRRWMIPRARVR